MAIKGTGRSTDLSAASMQQVAGWLEKLGLGQYAQRFAENDIDFALLTKLTDADLKELGVASLGHRKRLLESIAECGLAAPSPTPAEPRAPDTAERRQVTVMFSDLVGSTALSARMDPEDLREVITAYQKCVTGTVERFGGFVAKYMGDGVLVYFGYPQAHEDDPERAVRAGLELIQSVGKLESTAPLQTRVGITASSSSPAPWASRVGLSPEAAARLLVWLGKLHEPTTRQTERSHSQWPRANGFAAGGPHIARPIARSSPNEGRHHPGIAGGQARMLTNQLFDLHTADAHKVHAGVLFERPPIGAALQSFPNCMG
jgi:hypothetical protein